MPLSAIDQIDAPRLYLRPVEQRDLSDLTAINGDPEVTRFLPYETWKSMEDGMAWFSRMRDLMASGTAIQLVVVRKQDDKVIGTVLLFKFDEASQRIELGYVLARSAWGQGLMHEAVFAACRHAFDQLRIRRIEAEVQPSNHASCALLIRVGFRHEGLLRKRWVAKGRAYDTNIYGWLADDAGAIDDSP